MVIGAVQLSLENFFYLAEVSFRIGNTYFKGIPFSHAYPANIMIFIFVHPTTLTVFHFDVS